MPWYIEYDYRPFGLGKVERHLMELDCQDKPEVRSQAHKQALQKIEQQSLRNPLLVWKEEIL